MVVPLSYQVLQTVLCGITSLQVSYALPQEAPVAPNTNLGYFGESDTACQSIFRLTAWGRALPPTHSVSDVVASTSARSIGPLEASFFCYDTRLDARELPATDRYSLGPYRMSCHITQILQIHGNAIYSTRALCISQLPTLPEGLEGSDEEIEVLPGTTECLNFQYPRWASVRDKLRLWTTTRLDKNTPAPAGWLSLTSAGLDHHLETQRSSAGDSTLIASSPSRAGQFVRICANASRGHGSIVLHARLQKT